MGQAVEGTGGQRSSVGADESGLRPGQILGHTDADLLPGPPVAPEGRPA